MSVLGTTLREARIQKGYTLNTLQQITKIQKKYLEAIEEGNFEALPGVFYVRAFVKQYADVVGLDGSELLLEHKDEIESMLQEKNVVEVAPVDDMPSRLARAKQEQAKSLVDKFLKYLPFAILIAIVTVIMFVLVLTIKNVTKSEREAQLAQSSERTSLVSSVEPESAESASESSKVVEEKLEEGEVRVGTAKMRLVSTEGEETLYHLTSPVEQYKFEVKGHSTVWVGTFEDDQLMTDTVIAEGEKQTFTIAKGVKTFKIQLGYPEGATIYVNGTQVDINSVYFPNSVMFVVKDATTPSATSTTPSESESESSETNEITEGSYQGPAVLDPSRSANDGEE